MTRILLLLLGFVVLSSPVWAAGPDVGPSGQVCWDDPNPAGSVTGYSLYYSQTPGDSSLTTNLTVAPASSVCITRDMTSKPNGQWYVGVAAYNAAGRSAFVESPFVCVMCAIPSAMTNVTVK